jgi:serine/threonine protein kinase
LEGCSLSKVLSVNPIWWTSTIKAKAVAGIVFALRFAHSLGFVHGRLTTTNILVDSDHCIQIVDFRSKVLEVCESGNEEGTELDGFSREGLTPEMDIQAFASIFLNSCLAVLHKVTHPSPGAVLILFPGLANQGSLPYPE